MNDFLNSLKADLLDRRLLPLVAVALVALVAAVGYALLGGGSSASAPTAAVTPGAAPPGSTGLATAPTQSTAKQAVAETTTGTAAQRQGPARDPFTALPSSVKPAGAAAKASKAAAGSGAATTSSPASGSTKSAGSGSGSASSPSTGSTPVSTPKPPTPAKPKTLYKVSAQFGLLAPGSTPLTPLKSFDGLSKATPLPSAKARQIEFLGVLVTRSGTSATFALDSELIPSSGSATCLPSKIQCKMIELAAGKAEQLLGTLPNGESATYELRVVSIASAIASSASVKSVLRAQRRVVRELLHEGGLLKLTGLHYSGAAGVLVFATRAAIGAGAHVAVRHPRHSG